MKDYLLKNSIPEPNSGCWLWLGPIISGYGIISLDYVKILAHRASYREFNGPLIPGKLICHFCYNKLCINPDHLIQGTYKDNKYHDLIKRRQLQPDYKWWL